MTGLNRSAAAMPRLDYEPLDYRPSKLVRMNVMINGETVDALSLIVHQDKAQARGRELVSKMKEFIRASTVCG